MIGYLCSMLTNEWKMKSESGYVNEILKRRNDEKKSHFLLVLYGWQIILLWVQSSPVSGDF